MSEIILRSYGLSPVANVWIEEGRFVVATIDEVVVRQTECIYAFLIGEEIVRIGSSKAVLRTRFNAWQRDITHALAGRKSAAPEWEAQSWLSILPPGVAGTVWARQGTTITTPVGTLNAYMAEESFLIGRHLPRLNRSKHR